MNSLDIDNDIQFNSTVPGQGDCDPVEWRNELTPMLVEAIAEFIAGTPDPCPVTDALWAALLAGGMTHNQIALAVEKFLPRDQKNPA